MRKEEGIWVLEEGEEEEFEGVCLELGTFLGGRSISVYERRFSNEQGKYVSEYLALIKNVDTLSFSKLKTFIYSALELGIRGNGDFGFPEIGVTEQLRDVLLD